VREWEWWVRGLAGDVAAGQGVGVVGGVWLVTWQPVREWGWWVRGLAGDVAAGQGVGVVGGVWLATWQPVREVSGVMVLPRARDARLEPCYP
jgi:hypothetical protein